MSFMVLLLQGFPRGAAASSKGFPLGGSCRPQAADEGGVRVASLLTGNTRRLSPHPSAGGATDTFSPKGRRLLSALKAFPRGCARRRVSERNRRRRLLARRLKLSPKVTDEGRPCRHNPFAGNHSRFAPHPPLRGTFPLRGRLYYHHTTIRPIKKAPPVCGPAGQGWRERSLFIACVVRRRH